MTYEAVAEAFGRPLQRHAPTVSLMEKHYGGAAGRRRARLRSLQRPLTLLSCTVAHGHQRPVRAARPQSAAWS